MRREMESIFPYILNGNDLRQAFFVLSEVASTAKRIVRFDLLCANLDG